ncbi:S-layer homology domain-containing protein [Paenibacillus sp. SAF-054]|uniref:S-layer homology domain-containing protein n=1 Tax=unclassified Paenibacillus TaxID=185978 RepID=UPI003F7FF2C8
MLTAVLIVSFFPPGIVKAADSSGQYFQFKKFSTDQSSPTMVNTGTVELEGSFNGVSADSISFQVDSIIGDKVIPGMNGADVKPIVENEKDFRFPGVKLAQGLNRITVYGLTANGSKASGEAYVSFSNVPAIYNIKLPDGTSLTEESQTIVHTQSITLMLEAPNATEVMVNNTKMYNGGSSTFVLNDIRLNPGLNKLTFVATTDMGTHTYSVSREVVYASTEIGTPYNTKIGSTKIDNNSIVSGATVTGKLSGSIIYGLPEDPAIPTPTDFFITIKNTETGAELTPAPIAATVQGKDNTGSAMVFNYTTNTDVTLQDNGKYAIIFSGISYNSMGVMPVNFTYRNASTSYITGVDQLYSVSTLNANMVTYSSSAEFTGNNNLFELPLWIKVNTNAVSAASKVKISTLQKGAAVGSPTFTAKPYVDQSGYRVYQITGLPAGEQVLKIELVGASGNVEDSKQFAINYISAPFVELTNIYNNQVFTSNDSFKEISGRLVNFLSSDINSLKISINGNSASLESVIQDMKFVYTVPAEMKLVSGPNKISITGTANGIPVSTNLTVYLFPDKLPQISGFIPLPVGQSTDKEEVFKPNGNLQYTTYQTFADIQFVATNADEIVISVDGKQLVLSNKNTDNTWTSKDSAGGTYTGLTAVPTSDLGNAFQFTLSKIALPKTGVKSIVVQARLGAASISQTLQITRELMPYVILSPKLPNESVIKQNFLEVSIQADGADQVLIGKTPMVKGDQDIFRQEVNNLKKGKNTIKFTVVQGTQKLNGQFDVTYSDQVLQGAQYKTTLTSSGKLTAFQGNVQITFPKGTMLRDASPDPGSTNTQTINLFDGQNILLGIADPQDGRTVKLYNPVGEKVDGVYQDGKLMNIQANSLAAALLMPKSHFGYASNLYWIDPGYFKQPLSQNDFETITASHPYKKNNEFFGNHMGKWLEPTQQGTITLSYDPKMVNAATEGISVWKNNGGTWVNMGGKVNTSKKTITATFDGFGYYTVMSLRYSYDDIVAHPNARPDLELMLARGIMNPKDNNQFSVYENLTRGEFATMIVKMLDIPLDYDPNNLTFADVVKYGDYRWDYRYIETAVRKGIIRGTAPRVFSPNGSLTREEAANMIARAMNLKLGDQQKDLAALQKSFTDANTISSPYSITSIQAVTKAGIITGIPNKLLQGQKKLTYRFDPQAYLTRADAAVISKRIMTKMKKL